jgi:hypothetical protein
MPLPQIQEQFTYGAPGTTPALAAMWSAWHTIIQAADPWLDHLTTEDLMRTVVLDGQPSDVIFGSLLRRVAYHYWYHNGENQAIRQLLGHTNLPDFVGNIDDEAPYRPEPHMNLT